LSTAESFESLDVAVAGTKKLSITADDQIAELYLDGVVASVAPGDWTKVRFIDIRSDTKVIAVKAVDLAQVSEPNQMKRKRSSKVGGPGSSNVMQHSSVQFQLLFSFHAHSCRVDWEN
jgi:hypothetical protein